MIIYDTAIKLMTALSTGVHPGQAWGIVEPPHYQKRAQQPAQDPLIEFDSEIYHDQMTKPGTVYML